jgi:hypothetical protein
MASVGAALLWLLWADLVAKPMTSQPSEPAFNAGSFPGCRLEAFMPLLRLHPRTVHPEKKPSEPKLVLVSLSAKNLTEEYLCTQYCGPCVANAGYPLGSKVRYE